MPSVEASSLVIHNSPILFPFGWEEHLDFVKNRFKKFMVSSSGLWVFLRWGPGLGRRPQEGAWATVFYPPAVLSSSLFHRGEDDAQGSRVTCPKSHSLFVGRTGSQAGRGDFKELFKMLSCTAGRIHRKWYFKDTACLAGGVGINTSLCLDTGVTHRGGRLPRGFPAIVMNALYSAGDVRTPSGESLAQCFLLFLVSGAHI